MPHTRLRDAIVNIRAAGLSHLVVFMVLVKLQTLSHGDEVDHRHPRAPKIASFWRRLTGF